MAISVGRRRIRKFSVKVEPASCIRTVTVDAPTAADAAKAVKAGISKGKVISVKERR